jgi:hypothetical protein
MKKLNSEQFYTDYMNKLSVQLRYRNKDKRKLLFEIMDKYAEYINL